MISAVIRWYRPLLAVFMAGVFVSLVLLFTRGLREDYSLEAFVASKNDEYAQFRSLMAEFVSNELAVIAIRSEDAQSEATLALIAELEDELRQLEAVQHITSLADLLTSLPAAVRPFLASRVQEHPLFVDNLISRDGRTAAVLLQMRGEGATGVVRKHTVQRLKEIVAHARQQSPNKQIFLTGPYVTLIDMYDFVDRDLLNFSCAALVLLLVTLGMVFRRAPPVLFSLIVSLMATLGTLGCASALDLPVTLITQMIVILVMVLSVANCVHLAVADDEVFVQTPFYDWEERASRVIRRMAAPCCAVMVTTAVGFGSVSISSITPVRTFGYLMVLGLMLALVLSLLAVAPLTRARVPTVNASGPHWLPSVLRQLALWVNAHRGRVVLGFAAVSLVFAMALPRLRFESDFVKNFRPDSEVRRSYEFIESHLSPTGSLEVVVRRVDGGPIVSPEAVSRLRQAGQQVVDRLAPIRKSMTLADLLTLGPGGTPSTHLGISARLAFARRILGEEAVRNFLNLEGTAMRLNLRASEGISVHEKLELAESVDNITRQTMGPAYLTEVTGLYVFYAKLVAGLWRDQFRSLGLTVPAVLLALILVLRSFRVGLIAMVPTSLPIVFCLGGMGWAGIPVNMTTAMMLSVTLGIAVDNALHYLWRFRAALQESGSYLSALRTAHGSVGRACVFTTIVITGGFWILTLSRFLPTAYFGGLLAFTMCGALAGHLMLLPAMVMILRPFKTGSSS